MGSRITFARTIGLGAVALWTSAVADTSGDGDALGATRALFALGAVSQNTFAVNDLVGRLTLTFDAVAFLAEREGITIEAGRTLAFVTSGQVLTCTRTLLPHHSSQSNL